MSQLVMCPNCEHCFDVDDVYEQYEKQVAEIVRGELAPKGIKGYDVWNLIPVWRGNEVDGYRIIKYQVKYTWKDKRRNGKTPRWVWTGRKFDERSADFFVLFVRKDSLMFLIDMRTARKHVSLSPDHYSIESGINFNSWIWNYRVTPETFITRRDEMLWTNQLALEVELFGLH